MPTNAEMLAHVSFFAGLDDEERTQLAERLDVATLPKDKLLWRRGDPGDAIYVVKSGCVQLFVTNDTGEKIVMENARAGDFFGEIAFLDGGARTTAALVTEDLEALVVDRGDLEELFRMHPEAAFHLLAAAGRRLRETARLLTHTASRNVNEETEDKRSSVMKVADWISNFSGSLPFLFMHLAIFFVWIVLNVGPLSRPPLGGWDPFPFGLLTMVVSLEAIILSVFVLLSQNRQIERDRVRNQIEYEVNLKAELEIAHMHKKVDAMNEGVLARLKSIDAKVQSFSKTTS
jgi:CRP/FNR family cyclic AMP-dependent transcriptional regulator